MSFSALLRRARFYTIAAAVAATVFLAAAAPTLAAPPNIGPAEREAIRNVVAAQIDAFRQDNAEEAFTYAAPTVQSMFRSPETFLHMVREGYPPVYRPTFVEFAELVDVGGMPVQTVFVAGEDGRPALAVFMMEQQPDGSWLIDGCILLGTDQEIT